jgi:hypothetical protein
MVHLNIECIKFPECLGCDKIGSMVWRNTGSVVRVCSVYPMPSGWWRRGGCPIRYTQKDEFGSGKKKAGHAKRKDAAYLTKRGRVAT